MTRMILTFLSLAACSQAKHQETASPDTADTGEATKEPTTDWSLLADNVGQGALLGAWTGQGITHMVGGDMHGGPGLRVAYDGEALCIEANITERALWWIHGDQPDRWVAVGEAGTVLIDNNGARTRMDVPTAATLYGVWVSGDTITAVGGVVAESTGEVWQHDGSTWTLLAGDLPGVAFKIWESHIVGANISYMLQPDGSLIDRGDAGRLLTLRGDGEVITAVGGVSSSLIMQQTDLGWTELDSAGLGQPLNGVWTAPGQDIWVAGNFGTTARIDAEGIHQPDWPVTSNHFHAVWPHAEDEHLFIGGNFMSTGANFGTIARYGKSREPAQITEVLACE